MLKKNRWMMKQERRFKLYATGEIKYFKELEQKGCMQLTKDSSARKISRTEIEVKLNAVHKTYVLI